MTKGKFIHRNDMQGQQGVTLIAKLIADMGYIWRPTGLHDAGIDGHIEIRDPQTGEAKNALIGVQSKTVGSRFPSETDVGFTYTVDERDLNYWLRGNLPVILIISRPQDNIAYWMSIKDYFSTPERRSERRIRFNKTQHRLDDTAAVALADLALPSDKGIYLSPRPKNERLYCNLLPVSGYAPVLYIAPTHHRSRKDIWDAIRAKGEPSGSEWFLHSGMVHSFHDLRDDFWSGVCEPGSVDDLPTTEWADSADPDRAREFVQMLKLCLNSKLALESVHYSKEFGFHYFKKGDGEKRTIVLPGRAGRGRTVVQGYHLGGDYPFYRHYALKSKFVRYGQQWFLELEPTYHFTSDGTQTFRFYENQLSGIKRLERNSAVRYLTGFWAFLLHGSNDLYAPNYPWLRFALPEVFNVDFGIHDAEWKTVDDDTQNGLILEDNDVEEAFFGDDIEAPLFEELN